MAYQIIKSHRNQTERMIALNVSKVVNLLKVGTKGVLEAAAAEITHLAPPTHKGDKSLHAHLILCVVTFQAETDLALNKLTFGLILVHKQKKRTPCGLHWFLFYTFVTYYLCLFGKV